MKVFIIAAVSADGFIAKDAHHPALWTSKEDKARFIALTKEAGVVIMGSNTFKTLPRPLRERTNIVYTRSTTPIEEAELTSAPPADVLAGLEERGFKSVAICGGSQIYSMFMKAKVVDKIYLTIEPILFGKGITLFSEDFQQHLKLISSQVTEGGSVLLEYNVDYLGTRLV